MVNYYKILKISPKASSAEIKSAYRQLARKYHPDVNDGAENASREFSKIAKAYEILGNPKERAAYDRLLLGEKYDYSSNVGSFFDSENLQAKRWRQMAYERRYNEIVDRMIADERRESMALQKVIFPTVALFLSTCFVAIFKPTFWTNSQIVGKTVMFSLFVVGIIHLYKRLRSAFQRYTYRDDSIRNFLLSDREPVKKPYTRTAAVSFLIVGIGLSLGIGLVIGNYMGYFISGMMPTFFSATLKPDFVFYPPIAVLLVDLMHAFASQFDH